jgi:hypothetical protein
MNTVGQRVIAIDIVRETIEKCGTVSFNEASQSAVRVSSIQWFSGAVQRFMCWRVRNVERGVSLRGR